MNNNQIELLKKELGEKGLVFNHNLFPHLSLRQLVIAEAFFVAKTRQDLIQSFNLSLKLKIPFFLLGGGTNIAFLKKKQLGLVVKNEYHQLKVMEETKDKVKILVSSGYPVSALVNKCLDQGWSGLEYHLGLPGTVGGAIYMNSKWTKPLNYFGDNLVEAYILTKKGDIKKVDQSYFKFDYDYSFLQKTDDILLEVVFLLKKEKKELLKKRAELVMNYRKETQPFGVATCGCFFQNISQKEKEKYQLPTTSAGYLIDQVGLKGYRLGDFYISDKHANFIINKGKGSYSDLKKIIKLIKDKVKEKFGVNLKEEVVVIS